MQCIKVLGSGCRRCATIGDKIIVAVKNAAQKKKVRKHDVHSCIIIRKKRTYFRYNGIGIAFKKNSGVLIDKKRSAPLGTRIFGPFMYELRRKKYLKILSIATTIV